MQRAIDPNQLSEDWVGNNIAATCPLCKKVFVVSAHLNRAGRKCPKCGRSTAIVSGGKDSNGTAAIQVDDVTMTEAEALENIREAIDILGPDRVLFGTDADLCDAAKQIGVYHDVGMTPDEREKVMHRNAERLFRLP